MTATTTLATLLPRDRTWRLHRLTREGSTLATTLLAATDKRTAIHTRLIWAAAWAPDGRCTCTCTCTCACTCTCICTCTCTRYFATVSRDKRVVMWGREGESWGALGAPLTLQDSVTAVAIASTLEEGRYLLACGLECGEVVLVSWAAGEWGEVGRRALHQATVTRLAFRPGEGEGKEGRLLASCSADWSVRISRVKA